MKHRERGIRFAAISCGYSSVGRRAWAAAGRRREAAAAIEDLPSER